MDESLFEDEGIVVERLSADVKGTVAGLERPEVASLVGAYYRLQAHRIALTNQTGALTRNEGDDGQGPGEAPGSLGEDAGGEPGPGEPSPGERRLRRRQRARHPEDDPVVLAHFGKQFARLERQMVVVLDLWTSQDEVASWARGQRGIGPVLAAGLVAHIDFERAHTYGAVWRFAGLDPTCVWTKGNKRPWNADLKVLCWKIGDSFVKQHNHEDCYYGQWYATKKEQYQRKNEDGGYGDTAAATLAAKTFTHAETKAAYEAGRLPAGRIDQMARRWAVKLFLSHLWQVGREVNGLEVHSTYPVGVLGHAHTIDPPAPWQKLMG